MKKHHEFVEESQEQKDARWKKQAKMARTFAKVSGLDVKKNLRQHHVREADEKYGWYEE
jgi:hypothetical protein